MVELSPVDLMAKPFSVPKNHQSTSITIITNTITTISTALELLKPKSATITLLATDWVGEVSPYSQVVNISGVTSTSKIDLQPTAAQLVELQDAEITLIAENNNRVITIYALNNEPTKDYTMQVLITEVQSI